MDENLAKSIGYVYDVNIFCSDGSFRSVGSQGACLSYNEMENRQLILDPDDDSVRTNPLIPWMWRSLSVNLGNVGPKDVIVISGTPTVHGSMNTTMVSQCTLQVKNCQLLAASTEHGKICQDFNICGAGSLTILPFGSYCSPSDCNTSTTFIFHNDIKVDAL